MIDYIADYLENIRERDVFPHVQPGFLVSALPDNAPEEGETFEDIFKDVESLIMPGITHWQSPYMHAYFPALNSYPSLLGDMLANGVNCLGFTWASSPACTELEIVTMDWLAKAIGLPDDFLHSKTQSHGGGVIQTTASESTFVCLLAGRTEAIRRYQTHFPDAADAEINSRLVAYCSDQAHSSVEKAGLVGLVKIRYVESDEHFSLRGDKLKEAIDFDKKNGLIPFFLCVTLGTTGACTFDNLAELGPICLAIDYMHWQVPLSRRFRALKLWFVLRNYGISGLQKHIRENVALAKRFEELVKSDDNFEIPAKRHMGLVVFRLKGENELTERLLKELNQSGKLHCVPASLKGKYIIRFTVTSPRTTEEDICRDWAIIQKYAQRLLGISPAEPVRRVKLKGSLDTKAKDSFFGTSLLLANIGPNSPNTPKVINGSYAALFESTDIMEDLNQKFDGMKQDR
ncbi:hypothetical protein TCAL_11316, partial [Tigriopus californicus]